MNLSSKLEDLFMYYILRNLKAISKTFNIIFS